jgi:hypothetical protein
MYKLIFLGIVGLVLLVLVLKKRKKPLKFKSRKLKSSNLGGDNNPSTCYYIMTSGGNHMYSYMSSSGPIVQLGQDPGYSDKMTTKWYWNMQELSMFTMSDGGGASGYLVSDGYNTTIWNPDAYYAGTESANPQARAWIINGLDPTQDVNNCNIQYTFNGQNYYLSSTPVNGRVVLQNTPDLFIVYNACAYDLKQDCIDRSNSLASSCLSDCVGSGGACAMGCSFADSTRKQLCNDQSWVSQCNANDDNCSPPPPL